MFDWVNILITLVVSIIGAFTASYFSYRYYKPRLRADLQKEFESRFNERKWEAYQQFADILYEVLDTTGTKKFNNELPKVIRRLRKFLSQLWVVGSDDVMRTVSDWFMYSNKEPEEKDSSVEGLIKLMNILIMMRKDLGYSTSQIGPVDLLRTFINDLEKHIPQDN
jgi:hypothetical protein